MEEYTEYNRKMVDLFISKIASFRRMCERKEKKKYNPQIANVIMKLELMISQCFKLIDKDIDYIAKFRGVDRNISTDFGLSSIDTMCQVKNTYLKALVEVEKFLSKKTIALITKGDILPSVVEKSGLGYYEVNSPIDGIYPKLN